MTMAVLRVMSVLRPTLEVRARSRGGGMVTNCGDQPRPAGKTSERDRVLAELGKLPVSSWDELPLEEELSEEDADKDRIFFNAITNA